MYYYALTLSKTRGTKDYSSYEDYLTRLNLALPIKQYEHEGGLHVHVMIQSKTRVPKKSIYLYKYGWSIDFNELKKPDDVGIWVMYCLKHALSNIELEYKYPEYPSDITEPSEQTEDAPPHVPESAEDPIEIPDPLPEKYHYPRFDIRTACVKAASVVAERL